MAALRKIALLTLAWFGVVGGFLLLITPIPGGIVILPLSLLLLARESMGARRVMARLLRRWPDGRGWIRRQLRRLAGRTEHRL